MTQSIAEAPNIHAPPPGLTLGAGFALVKGYQSYSATATSVIPDGNDKALCKKQSILASVFNTALFANRSVLDLGANNAFFALWALHLGAAYATAVDMDSQCQTLIRKVADHLNYSRLNLVNGKTQDQKEPADVVLALALIHWVYSCTADFGSLDAVIGWLATLAKHALVVEWIAPEDGAIAHFKHTDFNRGVQSEPYSYDAFLGALNKHFPQVTFLGHVTPTRSLFFAMKTRDVIDLSIPLPLLHDGDRVLSSRFLGSADSLDFYSRVYDLGESILKQTSFDLASREGKFLSLLQTANFPKVIGTHVTPLYSTIELEKVRGESLGQAGAGIAASKESFRAFVGGCVSILEQLAVHGISHRDIRPENIIVRDGVPVLLDFGWAISPEHPYYTPAPFQNQPGNVDLLGMAGVLELVTPSTEAGLKTYLSSILHPTPLLAPLTLESFRADIGESLGQ